MGRSRQLRDEIDDISRIGTTGVCRIGSVGVQIFPTPLENKRGRECQGDEDLHVKDTEHPIKVK